MPKHNGAKKGKATAMVSTAPVDPRFETLIRVLDRICASGLKGGFYDFNRPDINDDKIHQARSRALVHLYLEAKHGMQDFTEREELITDGTGDGGIDGYYVDEEKKEILLFQSKLPSLEANATSPAAGTQVDELIKMEIGRILSGKPDDSHDVVFNNKIKVLQKALDNYDTAKYIYKVVFLGNFKKYTDDQYKKLTDYEKYDILSYERIYSELLFPVCSGTYFDPDEISITIDVSGKTEVHVDQKILTKSGGCRVGIIFVPTKDIGAALSKYKNAILQFNPRNYLSLRSESVNEKIKASIVDVDSNDFAVLNNGITILCKSFRVQKRTGTNNAQKLFIEDPQIINGGQTAFTLSKIYEEQKGRDKDVFAGKEVMLKLVELETNTKKQREQLVVDISAATNNQSKVQAADRRSNDKVQIRLQKWLFDSFGIYYERKKGEFEELIGTVIPRADLVGRVPLAKATLALKGLASEARGRGPEKLFQEPLYEKIFEFKNDTDFLRAYFAYKISSYLDELEKKGKKSGKRSRKYGNALRYGKMAVVAAIGHSMDRSLIKKDGFETLVKAATDVVLAEWSKFERSVKDDPKRKHYFKEGDEGFDNYYKQDSVNADIEAAFARKSQG